MEHVVGVHTGARVVVRAFGAKDGARIHPDERLLEHGEEGPWTRRPRRLFRNAWNPVSPRSPEPERGPETKCTQVAFCIENGSRSH